MLEILHEIVQYSTVDPRLMVRTPLNTVTFSWPVLTEFQCTEAIALHEQDGKRKRDKSVINREKHCTGSVAHPLSIDLWKAVIGVHII